ncbi:hypothetical protein LDENG_00103260 [Lucifuga dentata]|nr:hypothetical protein LDENG_00103260 [Lucifuga dentata]
MKRFSKISGKLKYGFILWEMIVSNVTCMKIEYIRLKHAKWVVWSFKWVRIKVYCYSKACSHASINLISRNRQFSLDYSVPRCVCVCVCVFGKF